jgi:C1A family cysteine protease
MNKELVKVKLKNKERKFVFNWKPDLTDYRDHVFKASVTKVIPSKIDLRPFCPPIYDQGELGSCVANAVGAAFQFGQMKQKRPTFIPSRLFIYYNQRVMMNTIKSDSGASLRNGIKTLDNTGVCPELDWRYKISKYTQKPPQNCYDIALKNQVEEYLHVNSSIPEIKHCLADGFPVAFGFTVYSSLLTDEVAQTGIMPMPQDKDELQGGHAVLAVGYDNSKNALLVRNSWGTDWGLYGYFWMPYDYISLAHLASDFWSIRVVE